MQELNKKIIGNAVSAYFMVWICIFFLFNKSPYMDHPFVKSHVKVAFMLHIILFVMLFIMSYPFLDNIAFFGYTLNTLITAGLGLTIFGAILYGMLQAHRGKSLTLWEMFDTAKVSKDIVKHNSTETLGEEETLLLILAQVPFLGYIIYPRHKKIPHIRDIIQLNIIVMLISSFLFVVWSFSLASIIILLYIIAWVFQAIRLGMEHKISTLDMSLVPTAEEKYILQKSLCSYVGNTLRKKTFVPLKKLREEKAKKHYEREVEELEALKKLAPAKIPGWVFYIPFLNLTWIFYLKTQEKTHIKNGITLTLIWALLTGLLWYFDIHNGILIFMLFPLFYGIGYLPRKAYHMPYIYDVYAFFAAIFWFVGHIFHRTRNLQKTDKQETIKIDEK